MHEQPTGQLINKNYNGTFAAKSKSVLVARDRLFHLRHGIAVGTGYDYSARNTVLSATLFGLLFQL